MSRLESFYKASRAEMERAQALRPLRELQTAVEGLPAPMPFEESLSRQGMSLIAEHKRRSPSAGDIRPDSVVTDVVRGYERGGAAAISIITQQQHWGGSVDDLRAARAVTELPLLRKDFIFDEYQVFEAREAGADAVLLIARWLEAPALNALYTLARDLDLDAIVEVQDERELEVALEVDAQVIGINNRDLETLQVDSEAVFNLMADIPSGKTIVSESGIQDRGEVEQLELRGVDAVLVGHTVMATDDHETAVRRLVTDVEH